VYLDLDTVVCGPLAPLCAYTGPFALLSVEGMANERRALGCNSSVMLWEDRSAVCGTVLEPLLRQVEVVATGGIVGSPPPLRVCTGSPRAIGSLTLRDAGALFRRLCPRVFRVVHRFDHW
jgi:hypothetical protein